MITRRKLRVLAILPVLVWAVACSDTTDPVDAAEEHQLNLDVAAYAANETIDDIAMMRFETDRAMFGFHGSPPFDARVSWVREVTFYDDFATLTKMDHFDRDDTDAIHFYWKLEGERSWTGRRGTMTVSMHRERDMWLLGLEGTEETRIWDGSGSTEVERSIVSDEKGERTYDMSNTMEVDALTLGVPRVDYPWPLSGAVSREVHVKVLTFSGEERTRDRTVRIEFNGTQFVPIWVNGEEYTLDLETREIVENTGG